jgi:hypothetical protein
MKAFAFIDNVQLELISLAALKNTGWQQLTSSGLELGSKNSN